MEPLWIQVVCPIFETKEPGNIGSLKQLIESLPSRDTKIFSVPRNLDAQTQLKIFQSVIQLHDIRQQPYRNPSFARLYAPWDNHRFRAYNSGCPVLHRQVREFVQARETPES